ncbi:sugar ABC transporter substrate-binding protein [Alicyclobacillus cellulosilyticus]|uniref:Sugar ABC transporter substrate-binding protein n=1 Tax=Alicyclobacillus cellulosilyticus TaxID=1003997 RepID=A0A917NL11_9BACL|nr:ABC transporter substrate-binding protein [Alicyclobacillus cellulosilyticus]GGJ08425.1 sugar ABC transporter substrate-binding protein [Alicyclobacillus cellulosilyticus]
MRMKRNVKRVKASFAAVVTLSTWVTGVTLSPVLSEAKTKAAPVNVVFWDLFGGADGKTMQAIVKQFNQTHPNIHIQEETQDWGQYYTKLTTAVLGGHAPDLAISHADHVLILKTQGVIQPLDAEAKAAGIKWSDFFGAPLQDSTIDGQHYAIPLDVHTFLLFYNKSLLKQAGLLNAKGEYTVKSYAQFVSDLTKVKKVAKIPLSFPENGWFPLALWQSFYAQMGGGDLVNSQKTKAVFMDGANKQKAIAAMQDVWDLYNKYHVIPPNISNIEQVFKAKKAAFIIDGTWNVDDFHNTLKNDLGVTMFPVLFGRPAAWANSHTFILPTNPKRTPEQTQAALTFVKWVEDHAWLWAKAGHIPANQTIQSTAQYKSLPFRSNYGAQGKFVQYFPETKNVWLMTDQPVLDVLQSILLKKTTVQNGLQQMANLLTQQLNQH